MDSYFRRESDADKSVQVIIFESLRKDWDKLREADRMLPESEVFVGDEPTLGRGDLFIPTFMVEIVYTMNTLIRGKRRLEVQQTFLSAKESLVFLNRVIDSAVWLESDPHFVNNTHTHIYISTPFTSLLFFTVFLLGYKFKY